MTRQQRRIHIKTSSGRQEVLGSLALLESKGSAVIQAFKVLLAILVPRDHLEKSKISMKTERFLTSKLRGDLGDPGFGNVQNFPKSDWPDYNV